MSNHFADFDHNDPVAFAAYKELRKAQKAEEAKWNAVEAKLDEIIAVDDELAKAKTKKARDAAEVKRIQLLGEANELRKQAHAAFKKSSAKIEQFTIDHQGAPPRKPERLVVPAVTPPNFIPPPPAALAPPPPPKPNEPPRPIEDAIKHNQKLEKLLNPDA